MRVGNAAALAGKYGVGFDPLRRLEGIYSRQRYLLIPLYLRRARRRNKMMASAVAPRRGDAGILSNLQLGRGITAQKEISVAIR